MISHKRILKISENDNQHGQCVVYVMSRDQRVSDNHALLSAQHKANKLSLPLIVLFQLFPSSQNRSYEHARFMIEGLEEVKKMLASYNIQFILTANDVYDTLASLKPAAVFFDFSPLKRPRQRVKNLANKLGITTYVVDTHNIIPTWVASDKQEFATHTFRRKVHSLLEQYLVEPEKLQKHKYTYSLNIQSLSFAEAYRHIESVYPKRKITISYQAGASAAQKHLDSFIAERLETYAHSRNNISVEGQSELSPYLHFGHISSLRVALSVLEHTGNRPLLFEQAKMAQAGETPSIENGMNALFEEMIIRKELSDNFCFYARSYTDFSALPSWCRETLEKHRSDHRDFCYTLEELESAKTHDRMWNAAQLELTKKGKMHGYMRMYWAKKILEWTSTPEEALRYAIVLNDRYSIDGGDPNGYVGILWSLGGLHDRPWTERSIFGKIRYMNEAGLKRKFDTEAYISMQL